MENSVNRWKNKTILFLGDSITQGCGCNIPYPVLLEQCLELRRAGNYGVSATHISGAYQDVVHDSAGADVSFTRRYGSMEPYADAVCVFGGTNDFGHRDTAPMGTMEDREDVSFFGALHLLCRGLTEKYPHAPILWFTPLHRAYGDGYGETNPFTGRSLEEYVEAIRRVACFYHLPLLDLYGCGLDPRLQTIREQEVPDGLHPNDEGHRRLAQEFIAPFLLSL